LGINSCQVLSKIIQKYSSFSYLDLSENNIGNEGISYLCEGILLNYSLVSLILSSNSIFSEGSNILFSKLKEHPSISSINLSNLKNSYKNMIANKGCAMLQSFLETNRIISLLNVSDNNIGNEGFSAITEGLAKSQSLVSLNLSKNYLPKSCIYIMSRLTRQSNYQFWNA